MCVLKSHSAGSHEAGDGCSAPTVTGAGRGREASALLQCRSGTPVPRFVCTRSIQGFVLAF